MPSTHMNESEPDTLARIGVALHRAMLRGIDCSIVFIATNTSEYKAVEIGVTHPRTGCNEIRRVYLGMASTSKSLNEQIERIEST